MKKDKATVIFTTVTVFLFIVSVLGATLTLAFRGADIEKDESVAVFSGEDRFNILITGRDRASGLSDVIMVVSLDRKNRSAAVMQIPRDTYCAYTDGSYKKLNGAERALGGASALRGFLSESLGISIDRYIALSPDAVCSIVDAVGGVEITLDKPMYYNDPSQKLYISLGAGKQTLNGKTAEQFIRYRSGYADGDLGRIDAQKVFLCGLIRSVKKNMSPLALAKLSASVLGKAETDLTVSDASVLADELLTLPEDNMSFMTAPGEAVVAEKSGASYYALSSSATAEALAKYFGGMGDGFDPRRIFLNESYQSFKTVYDGYTEYRVYTAKNISEGKIGIAATY